MPGVMGDHLLIVGASTRAAAFSALRAGLRPWCMDLFADADLRARCPAVEVTPPLYPSGLVALARKAPAGPWMYTGGLENRPRLVRRLSRERPLWGNDDATLRKVRNPFALHDALVASGVPCPEVRRPDGSAPGGHWLVKPIAGAGGAGIRPLDDRRPAGPGEYVQRLIEGEARSGVFVADGERATLLGVTRQLVGTDWLHAPPFRYCGSVGPLPLEEGETAAWERLGAAVTQFAGLRGLFGVDAVQCEGAPQPVEVNPRYTASVEVLEYANGDSALALHRQRFEASDPLPGSPWRGAGDEPVIGKAVYYAARPLMVPAEGPWHVVLDRPPPGTDLPPFADVPTAGQQIAVGRPVLTVFARGRTPDECEARLRIAAAELDRWFLT